jgi:apolipoprotein N-acyltransferase
MVMLSAALATFLFCTVLSLFPAAVGALQARWGGSPAHRLLLLMPLARAVSNARNKDPAAIHGIGEFIELSG